MTGHHITPAFSLSSSRTMLITSCGCSYLFPLQLGAKFTNLKSFICACISSLLPRCSCALASVIFPRAKKKKLSVFFCYEIVALIDGLMMHLNAAQSVSVHDCWKRGFIGKNMLASHGTLSSVCRVRPGAIKTRGRLEPPAPELLVLGLLFCHFK